MKIQPLYAQVLLRLIENSRKSAGGIELVGSSDETPRAEVVAVGQGRRGKDGVIIPLLVNVGDVVLVQDGDKIKVGGEEYILTKEDNIMAVIRP